MLCVNDRETAMYKLEMLDSAPDFVDAIHDIQLPKLAENTLVTEKDKARIRKMANDEPIRIMQCILKKQYDKKPATTESNEYESILSSIDIAPGVYIFNLTDAVILRADGNAPFPMVTGLVPLPKKYARTKFVPILSMSGQKGYNDIPIPNYDDIAPTHHFDHFETEWDKKTIDRAVFRGGPSGCGYTTETNMRLKLANMNSPDIDAKIVSEGSTVTSKAVKFDPIHGIGVLNTTLKSGERMSMADQSRHKYIIHVDGNVNAYRLLTTMRTGSLIIRVESEYTSWVDHLIRKNVHFIAVKRDLSDLKKCITWCKDNDDKCREIARAGLEFAKRALSKEFIVEHMRSVLSAFSPTKQSVTRKSRSADKHSRTLKRFSPTSPDGPPPKPFSPHSPDGPPPKPFSPHSPELPPPGLKQPFSPHSPDGPPPPWNTPDKKQPQSPDEPPPDWVPSDWSPSNYDHKRTQRRTPNHQTRNTHKAKPSIAFLFCTNIEPGHIDTWTKYLTSSSRDVFDHTVHVHSKNPYSMHKRGIFKDNLINAPSSINDIDALRKLIDAALANPWCEWLIVLPETAFPVTPKSALHASLANIHSSILHSPDEPNHAWFFLNRSDAEIVANTPPDSVSVSDFVFKTLQSRDKYNGKSKPVYSRHIGHTDIAFNRLTKHDYQDIVRSKALFLANVTPTFRLATHIPKQNIHIVRATRDKHTYESEARMKNTNFVIVADQPLDTLTRAKHFALLRSRTYYELVTPNIEHTTTQLADRLNSQREWEHVGLGGGP